MFFVPTHNRVEKLKRFFKSLGPRDLELDYRILLWKGDPAFKEYLYEDWPVPLEILDGEYSYCTQKLNRGLALFPDCPWYGFLADDIVLRTPDTLHLLPERAERFNIAFPDDGHHWPGHVAIGGELIRAMGFFAYPKLLHNCIDSVWLDIGKEFGLLRPCTEIEFFCEHGLHRDERQCLMDEAYERVMEINGTASYDYDIHWCRAQAKVECYERIREALNA